MQPVRAGAIVTLAASLMASAPAWAGTPLGEHHVPGEPPCAAPSLSDDRAALWASPLDRIVTIRIEEGTVREAIDRLAAVARVELSYSAELLPTGRRACLVAQRVPVGAVLETLLAGTALRPIVLGSTQVVLAPSRVAAGSSEAPVSRRASVLDRVVVTGSPDGAPQRGSPFALDVIDGAQLSQHGVGTLGEALDLSVPGVWTWTNTAGSITARYGSIRGASSFGVSAPKIYLDGVEVANPLLVTQLDPSRVARVEVIRGPQGAALYGADAISGVVNILTRHDGTLDGRRELQLSTQAGVASTMFAARDPFVQEHSLAFRQGTTARNAGIGVNVGTVGAYVPGASERRVLVDADTRVARKQSVLTGMARFSLQTANASSSFLVSELTPAITPFDSATGQRVAQYTVGGSVSMMPNLHWTHSIIAGVDGYRMDGLSSLALAAPLAQSLSQSLAQPPSSLAQGGATSVLAASALGSDGAADRASVRLRTVGRFDVAPQLLLTTTFAAEQAFTHERLSAAQGVAVLGIVGSNGTSGSGSPAGSAPGTGGRVTGGGLPGATLAPWTRGTRMRDTRTTYDNTGLSAQAMLAWRDRWFASAGVRAERTTGATPNAQQSLLPMLGVAHVREYGNTVLKLRGAFGTGIRPARTLLRNTSWMGPGQQGALASLDPERQSGTEAGIDLLIGSRTSVHLTRFDQRAAGLIQPVSSLSTTVGPNGRLTRSMTYTLQNVGAITNRGWELEGSTRAGALSLAGTLSVVDSRVDRVATAYRGELRVGDRMLDVPANTMSLTAAWVHGRLTLTSSAIRASDWIGYDRTAIATTLDSDVVQPRSLEGAGLRSFWVTYPGVTRWRAGAAYRLRGDLSLVLSGDNLFNVQTGAPDNATVVAGRTVTVGVRTKF